MRRQAVCIHTYIHVWLLPSFNNEGGNPKMGKSGENNISKTSVITSFVWLGEVWTSLFSQLLSWPKAISNPSNHSVSPSYKKNMNW